MSDSTLATAAASAAAALPVLSVSPVAVMGSAPGTEVLVRISAPISGENLPVIVFAHGFGSSHDGYAPLAHYWAAHGFIVVQPTFPDSRLLQPNPKAKHSEAVQEYLSDPRKASMWRLRVQAVQHVLDHLADLAAAVPGLAGRLDYTRLAVAGHSFGAQTAAALLGTRVLQADGSPGEDLTDPRIRAGVLLSVGGRGGDDLSPFAVEHFPHLHQSYAGLRIPTLVVAGDQDRSPLTRRGPDWFTDAYTLSPGADCLVTLFGAEHMLGGISGYFVTETTDENPARVAAVQQLTWAYLRSALYPGDPAWPAACVALGNSPQPLGRVDCKQR